jgi:hypothetical protein
MSNDDSSNFTKGGNLDDLIIGGESSGLVNKIIGYPIKAVKNTWKFADRYISVRFGIYQGAAWVTGTSAKYFLSDNDILSDGSYTDATLLMLATAGALTLAELVAYTLGERVAHLKSYLDSATELLSIRKVEMALTIPISIALSAVQLNLLDGSVGTVGATMTTAFGLHTLHNLAVGLGIRLSRK